MKIKTLLLFLIIIALFSVNCANLKAQFVDIIAGTVTANQTICLGETPTALLGTPPIGGCGSFTYQWQIWNGLTWDNIPGENNLAFAPEALTTTTVYRLQEIDPYCGRDDGVYTNTVTITVGIVMPASGASTIQCIDEAIDPIPPTVTSSCGFVMLQLINTVTDPNAILCGGHGTKTYEFIYMDNLAFTVIWDYVFTISDTTPPDISLKENEVRCVSPNSSSYTTVGDEFNISATDNCTGSITLVYNLSGSTSGGPYTTLADVVFNPGVTTVTCVASDCSGNTSQKSFDVTINSGIVLPVARASTIQCIDDAYQPMPPTVSSFCDFVVLQSIKTVTEPNPIICGGQGTKTYEFTFMDSFGDIASWDYVYTISDTTPPDISLKENEVRCVSPNSLSYTTGGDEFNISATDNCAGSIPIVYNLSGATSGGPYTTLAGVEFNTGVTTVSCAASDCSGNTSHKSFDVTINPSIVMPASGASTIQCIDDAYQPIPPTVSSSCGFVMLQSINTVTDPNPIICSGQGTKTYKFTYMDNFGFTATWDYVYTISDLTPPDISLKENEVRCISPGYSSYTTIGDEFNTSATDNCTGSITLVYHLSGATFGGPYTTLAGVDFNTGITNVTCSASDCSGNTSHKSFDVTINLMTTTDEVTITACDNYTWYDQNYTMSGDYSYTDAGCVTHILHLTISPGSTETIFVSACDSYTWYCQVYTMPGQYTHTEGCVTSYLNLMINIFHTYNETKIACEHYQWHGVDYTTSGIKTIVEGCNTYKLNLTINPKVTPIFTQLGPYTVGGTSGVLPAISNNGISGTWEGSINTTIAGTTTCHFTPGTGQCANNATMDILVNVPITKTLTVKLYLEGLYAGSGMLNQAKGTSGPQYNDGIADSIRVELHNSTAPYSLAYFFTNLYLNTDGTIAATFPANISGFYYLVIKHRNSIETWSSSSIDFPGSGQINFDFTLNANRAYGNNQKFLGNNVYGIFAGDISQDGNVDGSDMAAVDNSSTAVLKGYLPDDVNGDGIVDASDMAIIDNNSTAIVHVIRP